MTLLGVAKARDAERSKTSDSVEVAVRVYQFGARTNGNDCDKTVCERSQRFSGATALPVECSRVFVV
jgi:hypothetical protein